MVRKELEIFILFAHVSTRALLARRLIVAHAVQESVGQLAV
jgi:hypothetical protein